MLARRLQSWPNIEPKYLSVCPSVCLSKLDNIERAVFLYVGDQYTH